MGSYHSAKAVIEFKTINSASNCFDLFNDYAYEANKGGKGGDFSVNENSIVRFDNIIEFEFDSGREANIRWQSDKFVEFFKENGAVKIQINIMVEMDGYFWEKE